MSRFVRPYCDAWRAALSVDATTTVREPAASAQRRTFQLPSRFVAANSSG
jgi:hypothetical protein